jgi:hypothetical protein
VAAHADAAAQVAQVSYAVKTSADKVAIHPSKGPEQGKIDYASASLLAFFH